MAVTGTTIAGNPWAALFQSNMDALIVAEANSTFLEANPNQIRYNGGKTIKIADVVLSGLQDYDRSQGFESGTITMNWTDYTLTQDRGISFQVDTMDLDESANMLTAGSIVAEFGRTQVVPEIDSYRWATIGKNTDVNQATPAALADGNAVVAAWDKAITYFKELGINLAELAFVASPTGVELAGNSDKFQKLKNTTTITKGDVDYNVESYRGVPIIEVPSAQLKDTFTAKAGGGFTLSGKAINFILMRKSGAATAIVKTDKVRIFAPDVNQKADAYKIDLRVYHDIIIPKNAAKGIYVHKAV